MTPNVLSVGQRTIVTTEYFGRIRLRERQVARDFEEWMVDGVLLSDMVRALAVLM